MISQKLRHSAVFMITVLLLPFALALVLFLSLKSTFALLFFILLGMLGIALLISMYKLQVYAFMLLSLLLPFSVQLKFMGEHAILFPSEPFIVIVLFAFAWDIFRDKRFVQYYFSGESRLVYPFIAALIVGTLFSSMFLVSVKFALVNVAYVMVFYILLKYHFKQDPALYSRLIGIYTLSLLLVAIYAFYQFAQYDFNLVTIKGIFRPFYKDHTIFGASVALLAVLWFTSIQKMNGAKMKLFCLFIALAMLFAVVLSNSRAAFLSLVFGWFTWFILRLNVRIKHLIAFTLIAMVSIFLLRHVLIDRLQLNQSTSHDANYNYIERLESSTNISTDVSNIERINRWIAGIGMFREKPLTGFGPGTYQFKYIPFQSERYVNRLTVYNPWHIPENSGGTAHSEYILAMSEMGILGIIALLFIVLRTIWIAFGKNNEKINKKDMNIAFAAIASYFFYAFFNNFLNTDKFAFLFWASLAWFMALNELKHENRHSLLQ